MLADEKVKCQVLFFSEDFIIIKEILVGKLMTCKSRLQWTPQEDQLLKSLRDSSKMVRWNQIALKIKQVSNYLRTPKQCRERYISTARFYGEQEQNKEWDANQEKQIFTLYLQHGPKWTLFTKYFEKRSQNSIKNRFYNFLRKTLRKMNELNQHRYPYNKKPLKIQSLLIILELSKKMQNQGEDIIGYKINKEMELFRIRNQIIQISADCQNSSDSDILTVVDKIHKANCHLRHLGIFKTKSKKSWKLDKKRIQYILGMQKVQLPQEKPEQSDIILSNSSMQSRQSVKTCSSMNEQKVFVEEFFDEVSFFDGTNKGCCWTQNFNKQISDLFGQNMIPSPRPDFSL